MTTGLLSRRAIPGVLFAEDFDLAIEPVDAPACVETAVPEIDRPVWSQAELDDAVAIARAAGVDVGRDEAREEGAISRGEAAAELRTLIETLRVEARHVVETECARVADLALAMLLALVPSIASARAASELRLVFEAIVRGLVEPERLVINAHSASLALVGPEPGAWVVPDALAIDGSVQLIADDQLGPADLRVRWRGGSAERRLAVQLDAVTQTLRDAGLLGTDHGKEAHA